MATQSQIDARTTTALTDGEVDRVREIMATTEGTADDGVMVAAVAALSGVQNQRIKAYIFDDWDSISQQPAELSGGSDGINYSTYKHQYQVYARVAKMLGIAALSYQEWVALVTGDGAQMVTITLGGMYASEGSEF